MFWVIDKPECDCKNPTIIEQRYWSKIIKNRQIVTNNLTEIYPVYFIKSPIKWYDPVKCELCYPPDDLLHEIPLVETDMTSTVPTQQIRPKGLREIASSIDHKINNKRISLLNGCVYYGHIKRGKNHYQYYIDTQKYFHNVEQEIKEWLISAAKSQTENINKGYPVLSIIFSPEHNTNVGFAQYVNNYYYSGSAEIISINVDKEYRSNFICEHSGLINTIKQMIDKWGEGSVEFLFADDTINTGGTFNRASDLLRTLLPNTAKRVCVINKCFVLIDRLSNDSKKNYVDKITNNFNSFVHIDISSMRAQGDSCIGCKLQQEAKRLFKRSSTREMANYWAMKNILLRDIDYDNFVEINKLGNEFSYERLAISHIAQNVIFTNTDSFNGDKIFNTLICILSFILKIDIEEDLNKQASFEDLENREIITSIKENFGDLLSILTKQKDYELVIAKEFLKVISRPFFTFDFKVRTQVLKFFLIFTDEFMSYNSSSKTRNISSKRKPFSKIVDKLYNLLEDNLSKTLFLQNYLLEQLGDMKSVYLIRKKTLISVSKYIDNIIDNNCNKDHCRKSINTELCSKNILLCFWRDYTAHVQNIIDCSSDEAKSLWFESILITGFEYNDLITIQSEKFTTKALYNTLNGDSLNNKEEFRHFCNELFLLNTRILFDGTERAVNKQILSSDEYFMRHWKEYVKINDFYKSSNKRSLDDLNNDNPECQLFSHLQQNYKNYSLDVNKRYKELLKKLKKMLLAKYDINNINISLLTYKDINKPFFQDIQGYDVIAFDYNMMYNENINFKNYDVKTKIINTNKSLYDYGYIANKKDENYILLFFDNPVFEDEFIAPMNVSFDRELKKIAPVFIYIDFDTNTSYNFDVLSSMIIREILSYRNRLLRFFENDFAGDIYSKYAHSIGEKNILEHEKFISHTTNEDEESDYNILRSFSNQEQNIKLNEMYWSMFKNYTNRQIAKLFSRCFSDFSNNNNNNNDNIRPPMYPDSDCPGFFGKKANTIIDLYKEDNRYKMLKHILKFEIHDKEEFCKSEFASYNNSKYNLEYVRCILSDIFFTATKCAYGSSSYPDLIKKIYTEEHNWGNSERDNRCVINIYRTYEHEIDYLVIENPVNHISEEIDKGTYKFKNEMILKRLRDPLDFARGHMSLFTIMNYISLLFENSTRKTEFNYILMTENDKNIFNDKNNRVPYLFKFQTKLPILKGEKKNG